MPPDRPPLTDPDRETRSAALQVLEAARDALDAMRADSADIEADLRVARDYIRCSLIYLETADD
jgi:hypothetical protein